MTAASTLHLPVFYTCTTATPDGPPLEIAWGSLAFEEYGVMCGSHLIRPPAAWTWALARDAAALQPYRLTLSDLQEFGTQPHDIATQMNETLAERQLFSAVPEDDARIRQMFDAAEIAPTFALELADADELIAQLARLQDLSPATPPSAPHRSTPRPPSVASHRIIQTEPTRPIHLKHGV